MSYLSTHLTVNTPGKKVQSLGSSMTWILAEPAADVTLFYLKLHIIAFHYSYVTRMLLVTPYPGVSQDVRPSQKSPLLSHDNALSQTCQFCVLVPFIFLFFFSCGDHCTFGTTAGLTVISKCQRRRSQEHKIICSLRRLPNKLLPREAI